MESLSAKMADSSIGFVDDEKSGTDGGFSVAFVDKLRSVDWELDRILYG